MTSNWDEATSLRAALESQLVCPDCQIKNSPRFRTVRLGEHHDATCECGYRAPVQVFIPKEK